MHEAILLIIRRSWVRAPPAPRDPLTGREIRFRKTCKTERAAQIELGKLLAMAQAGRQPDSDVTVAQLLDQYVATAGWDVSIREGNLGYIRRTIKPALGSTQVRRVRSPLLARKFRTQYTIPGIWYLLQRRGWTCQLGARRAIERNDAAVEVWKKETWPRIKARRRPSAAGSSSKTSAVSRRAPLARRCPGCHPSASWDQVEGFSAMSMGPPGRQ